MFWPGSLAFPQISAPARPPRPLFPPWLAVSFPSTEVDGLLGRPGRRRAAAAYGAIHAAWCPPVTRRRGSSSRPPFPSRRGRTPSSSLRQGAPPPRTGGHDGGAVKLKLEQQDHDLVIHGAGGLHPAQKEERGVRVLLELYVTDTSSGWTTARGGGTGAPRLNNRCPSDQDKPKLYFARPPRGTVLISYPPPPTKPVPPD